MTIINQAREVVITIEMQIGYQDPVLLRQALKEAYPFERRKGYRYRAWLGVIKERIGGMRPKKPDPNQLTLF
ncbi:hypothetical protein [Undibacterium oligocarboniphilum]|uniref:Uncharacterized protein n=1 Tax=Undibacterium oligocarboniphilum TaxID=666702 RepID=A0A850QQA2_9BURK|nr:hypothetical protein [Undibacterium oligocarboniphilum]MBC3871474.1 hypothetical protein [Undibacterium oligocarboniphilum]NVO78950.1 hypothetical protein [Undibacterium oligocarboniphilum]